MRCAPSQKLEIEDENLIVQRKAMHAEEMSARTGQLRSDNHKRSMHMRGPDAGGDIEPVETLEDNLMEAIRMGFGAEQATSHVSEARCGPSEDDSSRSLECVVA